MALTLCFRKQIGSLTFNLNRSCYFSHNDIFIYIQFLKYLLYVLCLKHLPLVQLCWSQSFTNSSSNIYFYCTTLLIQFAIHAKLLLLLRFYLLKIIIRFMAFIFYFFAIGNILSYILCYFAFIIFSEVFFKIFKCFFGNGFSQALNY